MKSRNEEFEILRKLGKNPNLSQRKLARDLGFSLGKLNYCLKALKQKGYIKFQNFKKNPKKESYFYIITPRGISMKTKMTINFMKKKCRNTMNLKRN